MLSNKVGTAFPKHGNASIDDLRKRSESFNGAYSRGNANVPNSMNIFNCVEKRDLNREV